GALDEDVVHVVRLVVQDGRVAPRLLLLDPRRGVRRDDGVDVRADLRVAQQLDRVGLVQELLEILGHECEPLCSDRGAAGAAPGVGYGRSVKTIVWLPWRMTRSSACHCTARERTARST